MTTLSGVGLSPGHASSFVGRINFTTCCTGCDRVVPVGSCGGVPLGSRGRASLGTATIAFPGGSRAVQSLPGRVPSFRPWATTSGRSFRHSWPQSRPPGGSLASTCGKWTTPSADYHSTRHPGSDPLVNGTQVCVRYQTATGCSFPRCTHVHRLHNLPSDVLQWIADHHGALKGGHPQHT
ncbi:hypothetical protein PHMEG_00034251 [Phytophthora megakarya]|uniref:Uncharacterized protein n=1 Tax=Phytophthora megakarya TaxID=4795 RepID=A0A225URS4_9STRA|nr:hypothetical protein PHMEG_00034251 [Phytophthora megakarya]